MLQSRTCLPPHSTGGHLLLYCRHFHPASQCTHRHTHILLFIKHTCLSSIPSVTRSYFLRIIQIHNFVNNASTSTYSCTESFVHISQSQNRFSEKYNNATLSVTSIRSVINLWNHSARVSIIAVCWQKFLNLHITCTHGSLHCINTHVWQPRIYAHFVPYGHTRNFLFIT